MASTMSTLGIDRLSVAERILLVEEIWDSIASSPEDVPLTDEVKAELDRRLADYAADPHSGSSWAEVKARLRAQR